MQQERMPQLPTADEAERMMPVIRAAFAAEGVEAGALGIPRQGGLTATARPTKAQEAAITERLFGKGIVMVRTPQGAFGFAVMR